MASAPPGSGSKVEDESKAESLKLLKDQKDGKKKVEFKGPVEDRSCTDIPCCIIFVAYIVGMIIVGIIAFKEGDPDRLLLPSDSQGNICGKDNYADKKYLLFFDISTCATKGGDFTKFVSVPSCPTPQVCVSECPKENELGTSRKASDMVCKEGTETVTESNKFNMVKQGKCAPYYLVSQPVLYRCIPTLADNLLANNSVITNAAGGNVTKKAIELGLEGLKFLLNAQNFGMSIFEDMKAVWYWLLM